MRGPEDPHPSAEEQLILLSAGTAARREAMRARAQQLGARVDWGALENLLSARRLMPTLGPRVLELTGGDEAGRFGHALEQALAIARRQGALLSLTLERVQHRLAAAGIRCTPLKGPQLSEAIYGDPSRRLAADIDLLVARKQLADAVAAVRELGYASPTDPVDDRGLPSLHFALVHEHGELPPVELHWRIHYYEESYAEDRLLAPPGALPGDWRPAPVDQLVALLLFYARDGFMNLRLAADIAAWWDAYGSDLQRDALEEVLGSYPALERALLVSVRVAERTVGLPAGQIARQDARLGARERIAVRLADSHPRHSQPQLYANMGLIEGLLTPPGGLGGFVGRQVIPPRDVLMAHPRVKPGRRPSSRPGHAMRVLGRYALAMIGLFRPRHELSPR